MNIHTEYHKSESYLLQLLFFCTDNHISEVLQENEALKQRLELLELHSKQDKEALKADAEHTRAELHRQVWTH